MGATTRRVPTLQDLDDLTNASAELRAFIDRMLPAAVAADILVMATAATGDLQQTLRTSQACAEPLASALAERFERYDAIVHRCFGIRPADGETRDAFNERISEAMQSMLESLGVGGPT
jgi:hypothetical protein